MYWSHQLSDARPYFVWNLDELYIWEYINLNLKILIFVAGATIKYLSVVNFNINSLLKMAITLKAIASERNKEIIYGGIIW